MASGNHPAASTNSKPHWHAGNVDNSAMYIRNPDFPRKRAKRPAPGRPRLVVVKKKAKRAATAPLASAHTRPVVLVGIPQFGLSARARQAAALRSFAKEMARTEGAHRRWDGRAAVRWQAVASRRRPA